MRRPTSLLCRWSEVRFDGQLYDLYCPRCERWTEGCLTRNPVRACGVQPPLPFLWGRLISKALAFAGITPRRIKQATGRRCGCKKRASRFDRLGIRLFLRWHSMRRGFKPPRHYLRRLFAAATQKGAQQSGRGSKWK
jgi:hypothetical protein